MYIITPPGGSMSDKWKIERRDLYVYKLCLEEGKKQNPQREAVITRETTREKTKRR